MSSQIHPLHLTNKLLSSPVSKRARHQVSPPLSSTALGPVDVSCEGEPPGSGNAPSLFLVLSAVASATAVDHDASHIRVCSAAFVQDRV
jgi:hypothetical protein